MFKSHKIDLLALIPEKTFLGYEILVSQFVRNNEKWLRIRYSHERGSARELKLRRYIDIKSFGNLSGKLQAEGDKFLERRKYRVSFGNNLLAEHQEFIESILSLGINPEDIEILCVYNPNRFDKNKVKAEANSLATKFKIENLKIKPKRNKRIWYNYRTTIRSSILSEILLHGMNKIRKVISNNALSKEDVRVFSYSFLAKLLTGDGTLDIRKGDYNYPVVRIKTVDQNLEYLDDYCKILRNFGFPARVKEDDIFVKSSCSFENLLSLYKIGAFKNSNNWNKLIITIGLMLSGRRLKVRNRFSELLNLNTFTSLDMWKLSGLRNSTTQDWIGNLKKFGLIKLIDNIKVPYKYVLTQKAKEQGRIISEVNEELIHLTERYDINDLWILLNKFKIKNKSSREQTA